MDGSDYGCGAWADTIWWRKDGGRETTFCASTGLCRGSDLIWWRCRARSGYSRDHSSSTWVDAVRSRWDRGGHTTLRPSTSLRYSCGCVWRSRWHAGFRSIPIDDWSVRLVLKYTEEVIAVDLPAHCAGCCRSYSIPNVLDLLYANHHHSINRTDAVSCIRANGICRGHCKCLEKGRRAHCCTRRRPGD